MELVRSGKVFSVRGRRLMLRLSPCRIAQFAAFPGTQPVQRQAERDSNQPCTEPRAIAQTIESPIRAEHGFLSYILGIGGVAQDAASHAIRKWAALGKALLELAPRVSPGRLVLQLIPDRATWLDQNQLLHWLSCASLNCPRSPCTYPDAASGSLVQRHNAVPASRLFGLDAQSSEHLLKVGVVDNNFPRRLALHRCLNGAFIEGLKEPHLGNGVFFAAR